MSRKVIEVTINETFAELIELRNQTGKVLFHRINLAKVLLQDHEWVESPSGGGGDESIAIDRLEEECFGDCGYSLPQILEILEEVPQERTWKANKYNLRRMYAEMKERKTIPIRESREKVVEKENQPSPEQRVADKLRVELGDKDSTITNLKQQLMEARQEICSLRAENKTLTTRLNRVSKILGITEAAG